MTKKQKEALFHVTITSVGNSGISAGYGRMEDKNAVKLLARAMYTMAASMVGEDNGLSLAIDTCYYVLKDALKPEVDVKDRMAKFDEKRLEDWDLQWKKNPEPSSPNVEKPVEEMKSEKA